MVGKKAPVGLIAAALLLLLAISGFFIPAGRRTHEFCRECGLYRKTRTVLGLTFRSFEPTDLTAWHARRIGGSHEHAWARTGCSGILSLWGTTAGFACGGGERFARSVHYLPLALARLEPSGLDVELHRELRDTREARRNSAVEAAEYVDPAWSDEQARLWWSDARAWMDGPPTGSFEEFRRSRGRRRASSRRPKARALASSPIPDAYACGAFT